MKIPQYSRQTDINPANLPMADPQSMTQDYAAARRFGAEATELGATNLQQIVHAQQKLQAERDAVDVVNAVSAFSDEERAVLTTLKSAPARGMYEGAAKWYDETAKKYTDTFRNDFQRAAFAQKVLSRRETGLDGIATAEAKFHQNQQDNAFSSVVDSAMKDAALFADDDARIQATIEEVFGGTVVDTDGKQIQKPGWFDALSSKKGDELERTKLKGEFVSAVVKQLMLSNPVKAEAYLERYKADLGKSWENLKKNVEQAKFKADVAADPYRALNNLDSSEYVLDPLTEANNRAFAVGKIEKLERANEKVVKQQREEAEQQVMDLIEKGDTANAATLLDKYEGDRMLTPETRRTLRNLINSPMEASSDPKAYHELEMSVLIGKAGQTEILRSSLTIGDKNKLLKILKDDKDVRKSYDYAESMKSAYHEIAPTGVMGQMDQEKETRFTSYKRAAEAFVMKGGDPWDFYDKNIWKYRPGVPANIYGLPKTVDDVAAQEKRLAADIKAGKITTDKANLEAEKLQAAKSYFTERDAKVKNAGKK